MSKNYLEVIRASGLKLTQLAERMNMGESLLRYHLAQETLDPDVEKLFLSSVKDMLASININLKAVKNKKCIETKV